LAVKLGIADVGALAKSLTAKELADWMTYGEIEPFDEVRDDYRFALLCQLTANLHRDPNKSAYKLKDFLLKFENDELMEPELEPQQSWEEQESILRFMAMSLAAHHKK